MTDLDEQNLHKQGTYMPCNVYNSWFTCLMMNIHRWRGLSPASYLILIRLWTRTEDRHVRLEDWSEFRTWQAYRPNQRGVGIENPYRRYIERMANSSNLSILQNNKSQRYCTNPLANSVGRIYRFICSWYFPMLENQSPRRYWKWQSPSSSVSII